MDSFISLFKPVKFGLVLAIGTILFSFLLGGAFGAKEEAIFEYLNAQAQPVVATVYKGDTAKVEAVVNKSWNYFKRAHLHAGGIGTASMLLITMLAFMNIQAMAKTVVSSFIGFGSFGYSFFWLLAGMKAPSLGSTGLAKESLSWLAIPSAGFLIIGTLSVLLLIIYQLFIKKEDSVENAD